MFNESLGMASDVTNRSAHHLIGEPYVMRTRYLTAFLLASALGSMPALAQNIHAGSASGSYTNDFCPEVEKKLKSAYFEHHCTTSQGTGDNVDRVLAEPKSVGIGQLDGVAARMLETPGQLSMVDPDIGLECLYAVTSDPNVDRLKGLSPRMPVALPSEKSGSASTFRFLQSLDPGLAALRKIKHYPSAKAAVTAVAKGEAALAFFVQFPNTKNEVFQTINDAELTFVPVINRAILRHEVEGTRVYQPQKVVVTPTGLMGKLTGGEPTRIDTTCTPVVLFTGNPAGMPEGNDRDDQNELVKLLATVPRPSKGDWTDIFANAVKYSKDKFDELVEKYGS